MAFVVSLMLGAAGAAAEDFATPPPDAVADISRWELVSGTFSNPQVEGTYRFYVNPERNALYQLMRYRIRFRAPATERERRYRTTEKLVWNAQPGERLPLRCFEHAPGAAGEPDGWREMRHGDREYDDEMAVLVLVLGLHRSSPAPEASTVSGLGLEEGSP